MKKLGLIDDTFLRFESRRQPLHIGILMLLEPPEDAGEDFVAKLAERLRKSTKAEAPFNRRLVQSKGWHYWQEADDFDLAHHFVHTALPKPGRIRELFALVSRVHCAHLDRAYPLWRMYLIEGLEDGRIAVYMKIHHSMVDGVAGMRMLLKCMSTSAKRSLEMPAPWEVQTIKSDTSPLPVPSPVGTLPALRSLAREGVAAVGPVLREIADTCNDLRDHNENLTLAGAAPACIFNSKVSATRRFAAQSYSTERIRAVAQAYDATMNDVVLAMCSGALRRYLDLLGELPEESLTAGVPVSIRRTGSDEGNEIAFAITNLATDIDDPGERLRAIKNGMDYNKQRIQRLSSGQYLAYAASMLLTGTMKSLVGLSRDRALGSVVISHIPGPRRPMYWQGAKLCGLYPASLIIDSGALNITLVSRQDFVDFGIIACRKTVPQMQRLLDYLEDSLAELEATLVPERKGSQRTKRVKPKKAASAVPRKARSKSAGTAGKKAKPKSRAVAKSSPARRRKAAAASGSEPKARVVPKARPKKSAPRAAARPKHVVEG